MELLNDYKLPFMAYPADGNLYDDIDIHAHSVVTARYGKRPGYEQYPDICALPRNYSNKEIIARTTIGIKNYRMDAIQQMPAYAKKENLLLLQTAYYPLSHIFDFAYAVDSALVSSYMSRELRVTHCVDKPEYEEQGLSASVYSLRDGFTGRPFSFLVTGHTGCGKTVALNLIKNMYPSAIRHHLGDREYVQIPILATTSMVGNMSELITALASKIDEILDMGTFHADKVRSKNVGMKCGYMKDWIKRYHIGLLIIDEVQFMKFDGGSSSFENLVGISEDTGCALGMIGNNEVLNKLAKYPRLVNRTMANRIEVKCTDKMSQKFFVNALQNLWKYQWTKERTELTEEIQQELISSSMYNISMLKALLIRVQYQALKDESKKNSSFNGITAEYIHKIAEKEFSEMQMLILQDTPDAERKILLLLDKKNNDILHDAHIQEQQARLKALQTAKTDIFSFENEWKLNKICDMLTLFDFTETMIKRAIQKVAKRMDGLEELDVKVIATYVKDELEKSKSGDTQVKVTKKRAVDFQAEQDVRNALRSEIIGGVGHAVSNV